MSPGIPKQHIAYGSGVLSSNRTTHLRLWAAAKDAVDVAGYVRLGAEARTHECRHLPTDVVHVARIVAAPHHRQAVRALQKRSRWRLKKRQSMVRLVTYTLSSVAQGGQYLYAPPSLPRSTQSALRASTAQCRLRTASRRRKRTCNQPQSSPRPSCTRESLRRKEEKGEGKGHSHSVSDTMKRVNQSFLVVALTPVSSSPLACEAHFRADVRHAGTGPQPGVQPVGVQLGDDVRQVGDVAWESPIRWFSVSATVSVVHKRLQYGLADST